MIAPTERDVGRAVVWSHPLSEHRAGGVIASLHRAPDGRSYIAAFVIYDGVSESVKTPLGDLDWA